MLNLTHKILCNSHKRGEKAGKNCMNMAALSFGTVKGIMTCGTAQRDALDYGPFGKQGGKEKLQWVLSYRQ
jgi:hypothetical protein